MKDIVEENYSDRMFLINKLKKDNDKLNNMLYCCCCVMERLGYNFKENLSIEEWWIKNKNGELNGQKNNKP